MSFWEREKGALFSIFSGIYGIINCYRVGYTTKDPSCCDIWQTGQKGKGLKRRKDLNLDPITEHQISKTPKQRFSKENTQDSELNTILFSIPHKSRAIDPERLVDLFYQEKCLKQELFSRQRTHLLTICEKGGHGLTPVHLRTQIKKSNDSHLHASVITTQHDQGSPVADLENRKSLICEFSTLFHQSVTKPQYIKKSLPKGKMSEDHSSVNKQPQISGFLRDVNTTINSTDANIKEVTEVIPPIKSPMNTPLSAQMLSKPLAMEEAPNSEKKIGKPRRRWIFVRSLPCSRI